MEIGEVGPEGPRRTGRPPLARISHHHPAATADPLGLAGLCRASCSAQSPVRPSLLPARRACRPPDDRLIRLALQNRLDVVSATPFAVFQSCGRRLGALATGSGEKSGLGPPDRAVGRGLTPRET